MATKVRYCSCVVLMYNRKYEISWKYVNINNKKLHSKKTILKRVDFFFILIQLTESGSFIYPGHGVNLKKYWFGNG
jgi:hypothetical protein